MRKDKKQLIGDEIGDEQIKLFLDFEPVDATSPSLHKLIKAYRGLRIDDFGRFLTFFKEAGYDLDGKDEQGQTFVDIIKDQRNADEYIELIDQARGRSTPCRYSVAGSLPQLQCSCSCYGSCFMF